MALAAFIQISDGSHHTTGQGAACFAMHHASKGPYDERRKVGHLMQASLLMLALACWAAQWAPHIIG